MKKYYLIFTGLLAVILAQAKEEYSSVKNVSCQQTIEKIQAQYLGKDYKMMVYGKNSNNSFYGEILVVSCNNLVSYWHLKNDSVMATGLLNSDSMFKYKNYKKTGVRSVEEFSAGTYIPPIYAGVDTEYVIYRDNESAFYFEYGKYNCFYKPDPKYDKYRREWLDIIRHHLSPLFELKRR